MPTAEDHIRKSNIHTLMLEDEHLEDLGQQTIYGIWDRQTIDGTMLNGESFTPVSDSQLEQRSLIQASEASRGGFFYYAISGDTIDWDTQRGWFLHMNNVHQQDDALRAGERSIADVQNFGRSAIITSTVLRPPPEGEMRTVADLPANYVFIVNAQIASPELSRSFDIDGDGRMDAYDTNSDSRVDAGYAVAYAPQGGFTRGILREPLPLPRRWHRTMATKLRAHSAISTGVSATTTAQ